MGAENCSACVKDYYWDPRITYDQRDKELDDLDRGYSMYIPPPKKKEKYDPNKRKSLFAEEFDLTVDPDA